jgi:fatty acid-binding protein DegV
MLLEKYPDLKIEYAVVNPTAGSHCGPECIGIAFYAKHK